MASTRVESTFTNKYLCQGEGRLEEGGDFFLYDKNLSKARWSCGLAREHKHVNIVSVTRREQVILDIIIIIGLVGQKGFHSSS